MPDSSDPRLLTRAEVAGAFRVHMTTVTGWEREGMPIAERGSRSRPSFYSLPDVVTWYVHRELAARGVRNGTPLNPAMERALLDRQRREEIEQRMAVRCGELVEAKAVATRYGTHVIEARNRLLGLPSRLKVRRPALTRDDLDAMDEEIRRALENLADGGEA